MGLKAIYTGVAALGFWKLGFLGEKFNNNFLIENLKIENRELPKKDKSFFFFKKLLFEI